MGKNQVAAIESTVNKTHVWLKDLCEIGGFRNQSQAYTALRAALHALRDRLTVDEATHLGAQLPMLIRGIYYEGWKPALAPNRERTEEEFLDSVAESLRGANEIDPPRAVKATFRLLSDKITAGEIGDIVSSLPRDVQRLWLDAVVVNPDEE